MLALPLAPGPRGPPAPVQTALHREPPTTRLVCDNHRTALVYVLGPSQLAFLLISNNLFADSSTFLNNLFAHEEMKPTEVK